ncbi:GNAT family N-acetyltransferase [Lactobacillus sp. S2-2]|nr:GNAT family N-acetyltransferase [Lactobacillus sp. S2-2]
MKLRVLEKEDLPELYEIFNQKSSMDYWFEEPMMSYRNLEDFYEKQDKDLATRLFVIDQDGEFAGLVGLIDIDYRHRHAEIEIVLSDEFSGQGLAQRAFEACSNYGFKTLNLHRIYLYVDAENKPAIHIYEKYGFEIEGTLKEQYYVNGDYHNAYLMAKLEK